MIKFENWIEKVDDCYIRHCGYRIIAKRWRWFEIAQRAVDGTSINGVMACNFFDAWMLEFLDIEFESNGWMRNGLLISFDRDAYSNHRCGELTKQIKVEIVKSILINFFNAEVVDDSCVEKYFIEGMSVEMFFDKWGQRVSACRKNKRKDYFDGESGYCVKVDGKVVYKQLDSVYFYDLGMNKDFYYDGIYDSVENKIKFTGISLFKSKTNKYVEAFGIKRKDGIKCEEGVHTCEFEGTTSEFETLIDFL